MENKVIAKEYVEKCIQRLKYLRDNPKEAKHYIAYYDRKIETLEDLLQNKILEDK